MNRLIHCGVAVAFIVGIIIAPSRTNASEPDPFDPWIEANLEELVDLYKHFHRNPELSHEEYETAKRVAAELGAAGYEVTTEVGGTGVVGVLHNGEGPTVLVRSDLDALPVTEATGLPYASKVQVTDEDGATIGVMHACGHDIHMASLIGTARWLAEHQDQWSGTVVLVGQPAEERVAGAAAMLADGLYERFPKPDHALALHVANDLEAGKVGYCSGPAMASATAVDVFVRGKGGHGAMPHAAVDPIVLAASLILDLQTIVSREIKPIEPAVITVGSIHGGSKHNIIPPEVHLQLTLRAYDEEVREQLIEGIERRAKALALAYRAPEPEVVVGQSTPPTINTPELVDRIVPIFNDRIGADHVEESEATMGAEDFGLYGQDGVPTFMFWLGSVSADRLNKAEANGESLPSLHSPLYYPDPDPTIETGIRAMTSAVVELLPPGR